MRNAAIALLGLGALMLVRGAIAGVFDRGGLPRETRRWIEWQWYIGVGSSVLGTAALIASTLAA